MSDDKHIDSDLTSQEAKEILGLLEKQDDVLVVRVRKVRFDESYEENVVVSECSHCDEPLKTDQSVYMWGVPFGSTPEQIRNAKTVSIRTICSDECLDSAIAEWVEDFEGINDIAIGYFA